MSFTSTDNENRVVNGTLKAGDGLETFIEFTSSYDDDFETVTVNVGSPITICHGSVLRGYQGYQGNQGYQGHQGISACVTLSGNAYTVGVDHFNTNAPIRPDEWQVGDTVCISQGTEHVNASIGAAGIVGGTVIFDVPANELYLLSSFGEGAPVTP